MLPQTVALSQLAEDLNTSLEVGLSEREAELRLGRQGLNQLPAGKQFSWWSSVIRAIGSPIVLLLVAAFAVTLALHEWIEAGVIAATVFINTVLELIQEFRASQAIAGLSAMQTHWARVVRNGQERLIDARKLVAGDIAVFEAGDKIPADGRLLEVVDVRINESLLTGESAPVGKRLGQTHDSAMPSEQFNMVFSGSLAVSGHGVMLVTATGGLTQLGRIAEEVADQPAKRTVLEARLAELAKALAIGVPALAVVVFALGVWRHIPLNELFLFTVSLVVSVVPEGLTLGVTTALAVAAWRMAHQGALLRNLASAETLGSTTILAVDKTGTLTKNRLSVAKIICLGGQMEKSSDAGRWEVVAEVGHTRDRRAVVRQAKQMALVGALCNTAELLTDSHGRQQVMGDPLEGALKQLAQGFGFSWLKIEERYPRLAEVPFLPVSRYMATAHRAGAHRLVAVKGAPDEVLSRCTFEWLGEKRVRLNRTTRQSWLDLAAVEAAEGLRLLGIAYKEGPSTEDSDMAQELGWLGLVALADPLQEGVAASIARLQSSGVRVMMLTGDHALTAQAIARAVGLPHHKVIDGHSIDGLTDAELARQLKVASVCARVTPVHKQRIVSVLQKHHEVVAMTGDGVNDAPALVAADIGVAMGHGGTDVAREAADVVLLQNQFSAIARAVYEGRSLIVNIRKMIVFLLSSNASALLVVLLAFAFGLPAPALASQILWLNLVIDGLPDTALIFEPLEEAAVAHKPEGQHLFLLSGAMIQRITFLGLWIGGCAFGLYVWACQSVDVEYARTMVITLLVVCQLGNCFNAQSATASVAATWLGNRLLLASAILGLGAHVWSLYSQLGQEVFRFVPLNGSDWLIVLLLAATLMGAEELRKWVVKNTRRVTLADTYML